MPNCSQETANHQIEFDRLGRHVVQGQFDGGSMTSDAGVMLLGATNPKLGLMQAAAHCITDPRSPLLIKHGVADMLCQRVYCLALGWEDLNDHGALRGDVAMQTAVGVDREVASAPTLCRLEKSAVAVRVPASEPHRRGQTRSSHPEAAVDPAAPVHVVDRPERCDAKQVFVQRRVFHRRIQQSIDKPRILFHCGKLDMGRG